MKGNYYERNLDIYLKMPPKTQEFVDKQIEQMNKLLKENKDAQKELQDFLINR